ncbi:hypothetical protein BG004_000183, partial [Podila humilis]
MVSFPLSFQWPWTSETQLFAILTAKASPPLFHPWPISNVLYTILFLSFTNALHGLLLTPVPRSTRAKQCIATPLIIALSLLPFLTRPSSVVVHQSQCAGALVASMRMFDLFFVRPARSHAATAQLKKKDGEESKDHIKTSTNQPLVWNRIQLRAELWAPVRRVSSIHIPAYDPNKPGLIPVKRLIKRAILYILITDVVIFSASRFRVTDIRAMSTAPFCLFMCLFGFIHFSILLLVYLVAIGWSLATGQSIDPQEWTLLVKPMPYFAATPVEFWSRWHSTFRTTWVELGFLPVQSWTKEHLGPDRVGTNLAQLARLGLPVMAVFALSGLLHGGVVLAVWDESPWAQMAYFLTQGVAVVVTRATEMSSVGAMIRERYEHGSQAQRMAIRAKQILAAPLLLTLLLLPLLYTCPYQLIHVALTVTSAGVSTRMIDLYFVQPWTGVPSRYYLRFLHASTCRSKKADSGGHKKKQASARREEQFKDLKHYERMPLMWDMKRLQIELWSPVRIFSEQQQQQQQTLANANKRRLWTFGQLACYCLVYSLLLDIIIFALSSFTVDEVMRLPLFQYGLFVGGSAAFIIYFVLQVYYTVATVWSYATGNMADPREWTMLNNYLPCFAASPADFWNNWQTLFRYLWVDLGYLPVQRWCRHFLNGDRRVVPRQAAYVAYECLPLMAVFTLSGLFHAYVVHALWRENGWSQIVFFWIHGVAVLLTKALERTLPGQKIRN